ncbi:hypothetical protein K4043_11740 [Stenotrophomonas sp. SRS1]|uniref:hypothetical protein n=1 Tax=Stenotrophomonas sp. SRS1 TaxID=2870345 RepID=UPI0022380AFE|nr:hypothetical protein [Stenotrophomonas sp. SRS1]MCW6028692.1 hypothetical protein [Stenotrophomonas sp. SRS1]
MAVQSKAKQSLIERDICGSDQLEQFARLDTVERADCDERHDRLDPPDRTDCTKHLDRATHSDHCAGFKCFKCFKCFHA